MRRVMGITTMLAVLAMAACANATPQAAESPTTPVTTPATTPASTTPAPATPAPTTQAPKTTDVLVEYGRQGGLAGLDDRIIVKSTGEYTVTRRARSAATGRLTADELAKLRQLLQASDFAHIPHVNPGNSITDGFKYRIVYQDREVLAEDGGVPPKLDELFGALNVILAKP